MQTQILKVQGMSCDACVGHVTKALQELDGVQSAEVTLANEQAVVTYDPARVQVSRMVEVVEEEGYEAAV
ncbi:MAG: heavy-metal-associated domain-containing protein [Janthinobacterium lividum]